MSTYAAPLRDMLFTMKEVGGLDAISWYDKISRSR